MLYGGHLNTNSLKPPPKKKDRRVSWTGVKSYWVKSFRRIREKSNFKKYILEPFSLVLLCTFFRTAFTPSWMGQYFPGQKLSSPPPHGLARTTHATQFAYTIIWWNFTCSTSVLIKFCQLFKATLGMHRPGQFLVKKEKGYQSF